MEKDNVDEWYKALKRKYANMPEEIREYWNKRIDEEYRRRNVKNSLADDPRNYANGRHLGEQDIGDISYKVPWQKIVRDQLGLTVPINTNYKCPVCGKMYGLEFPPERCMACGCKSFLHMRKLVNLKY